MSKTRKKRCGHYNAPIIRTRKKRCGHYNAPIIRTRKKRGGHYNAPVANIIGQIAVKTSHHIAPIAEASVTLPTTAITKQKLETKCILIRELKELKNKSIVYILRDDAKYALSYKYIENKGFLRINKDNILSEEDEFYYNPSAYELTDINRLLSEGAITIYTLKRYNKNHIFSRNPL